MSFYTGTHGRMEIRKGSDQTDNSLTTPQLYVRNWQVTTSMSQLDATTLGDTDKVPVNGIRTTRGSCQILYYKENGKESSTKWLFAKLIDKRKSYDRPGVANEAWDRVWLHLFVKADGNQERGYTMEVHITSASMANAVGEVMSANIQFESVGAVLDFQP